MIPVMPKANPVRFEYLLGLLPFALGIALLGKSINSYPPLRMQGFSEGDIWFYLIIADALVLGFALAALLRDKNIHVLRKLSGRPAPLLRNEGVYVGGWLLTLAGAVLLLNGGLDHTPHQKQLLPIHGVYARTLKDNPDKPVRFWLSFEMPTDQRGYTPLGLASITRSQFDALDRQEDKVAIEIKPGYFGIPWVARKYPVVVHY